MNKLIVIVAILIISFGVWAGVKSQGRMCEPHQCGNCLTDEEVARRQCLDKSYERHSR